MKTKIIIFCFLSVLSFCFFFNYAAAGYEEVNTSLGKVITGLNKEEALEKFGPPASAAKDI